MSDGDDGDVSLDRERPFIPLTGGRFGCSLEGDDGVGVGVGDLARAEGDEGVGGGDRRAGVPAVGGRVDVRETERSRSRTEDVSDVVDALALAYVVILGRLDVGVDGAAITVLVAGFVDAGAFDTVACCFEGGRGSNAAARESKG